jgi:hypothetical protein
MRLLCALVLAAALPVTINASAARDRIAWANWSDARHGWISCGEASVCSTENGGRSWHRIFSGGNYVFSYRRTSATAGVVEAGNWASAVVWTRDNGRTWYELPNVSGGAYRDGGRGPFFGGRGRFLFWHQQQQTLYQLTPWPAPQSPPCNGQGVFSGVCPLPLSKSPFQSSAVATIPAGRLAAMASIRDGVAALVVEGVEPLPGLVTGLPTAVLIHRGAETRIAPLPEAPLPQHQNTCTWIFGAWPKLFVAAALNRGGCDRTPRVLWRSQDGGSTWELQSSALVRRKPAAVKGGRPGAKVVVPGGWVAALRGPPARLAVRALGRTRRFALPVPRRCRVSATKPTVDWPSIFVTGRGSSGATPIQWWSSDGGATWDVFRGGGC